MRTHFTAEIEVGAQLPDDCTVWHYSHIRQGASIGSGCVIGRNVFIDEGVVIGKNCKIQNGSNLYKGSVVGNGCFIGPGVILANDKYPSAVNSDGTIKTAEDWECSGVTLKDNCSLGAGVIVLPGVTVESGVRVGAGAVVSKDAIKGTVVGIPAKALI